MVELSSSPPFGTQAPLVIGATEIRFPELDQMFSISPWAGQTEAVSAVLTELVGARLPEIACLRHLPKGEIFWSGREQWMCRDASIGISNLQRQLEGKAAVTDQSDAWALFHIGGGSARSVMARLTPLDLRPVRLSVGQVARTDFAHMMSIVIARADGFDILVMRSFAKTALRHAKEAALSVQALRI